MPLLACGIAAAAVLAPLSPFVLPLRAQAANGRGDQGLRLAAAAPADAFAYLSFAGFAAASQAVEKLTLWQLWQEPQVQAFFAPLIQRYTAIAAQMSAEDLQGWKLFEQLGSGRLEVVARGYGLSWQREEPMPMPGLVLALDVTGHEQQLDGLLRQQLEQLDRAAESDEGARAFMPGHAKLEHGGAPVDVITTPGRPRFDVYTARRGNLFLLGSTKALFFEVLDNLQGNAAKDRLESSSAFARARSKAAASSPVIEAWLNVDAIVSRVSGLLPDEVRAAAHVLGIDAITGVYYASAVRDGDSFDTLYVDAPEPRRGLLRTAPGGGAGVEALAAVPKSALWAGAFQLDLAHTWDVLWQAAAQIVPAAQLQMARAHLAQIESHLGFTIRDEGLAALGSVFTMFVDLQPNSPLPSFVLEAALADEAKARDVVKALVGLSRASVRDVQYHDQTLHLLTSPEPSLSPCYAIVGGKLLLSPTVPGLRQAVTYLEGKGGESITAQDTFRRTFDGLDLQGASAIEFLDVPRLVAWGYGLAENVVPGLGGGNQPLPIDPAQMPPREVIVDALHGFGGVAHGDQDGLLYRARTFGLSAFAALGSAFLMRAPGVPPEVLQRLGQEFERGMRGGQLHPRRVVLDDDSEDSPRAAEARPRTNIVNPVQPGDPREQELERELAALDRNVAREPDNGQLYFQRGLLRSQLRQFDGAVADYEKARELGHNLATSAYNIACSRSLQGQKDAALKWLGTALDEGFASWDVLDNDSDLEAIRNEPRFRKLVGDHRR